MRSNGISTAGPDILAGLDVTQLTVALGASDMPARARNVSHEQLAAWAEQGISRVGMRYVELAAKVTHHIDYAERGIGTATSHEVAILRGVWPSAQRLDAAYDGAYALRKHLAAETNPELAG
jgi:hypothetical protein